MARARPPMPAPMMAILGGALEGIGGVWVPFDSALTPFGSDMVVEIRIILFFLHDSVCQLSLPGTMSFES